MAAYNEDVLWTAIILGNMLLSGGELILTPAVFTAISNHSPAGMRSTMMACWMLFVGLGGYLSGLLASATHVVMNEWPNHLPEYTNEFLLIAGFTFMILLILVGCMRRITKMLG